MADMNNLRRQIDQITLDMLEIFKKRQDVVKQIGIIKETYGKNVSDESREEQLRQRVLDACGKIGLEETTGTRLLNFLLNESIKIQSDSIPHTTHMSIFAKAKEMEKDGKDIIHMEVGEPDFSHPPQIPDLLKEACVKGRVKYGTVTGDAEFRGKIADFASSKYKVQIRSDNVLVTPGARFAIYLAIQTLLEAGNEVIIIEPAWPAYRECAISAKAKPRIVHTKYENNWEPSIEEIKERINSNTKMIILNYPNNPTGKILSEDTQKQIVSLASEYDLYILSDEIYSQYSYSKEFKSIASFGYAKSIIAQSFSKSHAMTGFRIGYAIADCKIIDKMSRLQALCITSVPDPIQYAAMNVLENDITENSATIHKRLDALTVAAKDAGLEFSIPDGAMYVFCHLPSGIDGTVLSEKLLEQGVAVAPGEAFGQYRDHIRISACADIGQLIKGVKTISDTVNM